MTFFSLNDCDKGDDFARALQVTVQTDMYSTSWVKLDGTEYTPGLDICTEIKNEFPFFSKITNILVLCENVHFVDEKLVTIIIIMHSEWLMVMNLMQLFNLVILSIINPMMFKVHVDRL